MWKKYTHYCVNIIYIDVESSSDDCTCIKTTYTNADSLLKKLDELKVLAESSRYEIIFTELGHTKFFFVKRQRADRFWRSRSTKNKHSSGFEPNPENLCPLSLTQ